MNKFQKTGVLGAMLLLPVFSYLVVSGNNRPGTDVPNEFYCNLSEDLRLDSNVHLYILDYPEVVQDLLWFEGLLEKSDCYTLSLVNSKTDKFLFSDYDLMNSERVKLSSKVIQFLSSEYSDFGNAFLVDEFGELRGVYDLRNLKDKETAKIEFFILSSNNQLCQKNY